MTRRDDEIWSLIAAEYALGTLRGPARRRFEALRDDAYYCNMAQDWELRFQALADALAEARPDPDLWCRIEATIEHEGRTPPPSSGAGGTRGGGRLLSVGLAALALGGLLLSLAFGVI